jgi:hypothetical protein
MFVIVCVCVCMYMCVCFFFSYCFPQLCEEGTAELAPNLQLGSDFILVPQVVWKQLLSW